MGFGFQDAPSGNSDKGPSFVKEAFKIQYNWITLAAAGAFAVVSGSLLPVLLAAGAELMYLSIIPQNSRFQRLVRSWKFAEEKQISQQERWVDRSLKRLEPLFDSSKSQLASAQVPRDRIKTHVFPLNHREDLVAEIIKAPFDPRLLA